MTAHNIWGNRSAAWMLHHVRPNILLAAAVNIIAIPRTLELFRRFRFKEGVSENA
jgi:hypothetical protein